MGYNYKNESNKLFDRCSKNESIMLLIYCINFIFMLLIFFDINDTINTI